MSQAQTPQPYRVPATVSLAPDLLRRLDAFSEALERSRSFIVAKAVESFLAAHSTLAEPPPDSEAGA